MPQDVERTLQRVSGSAQHRHEPRPPRVATESMGLNQGDVYVNFQPRDGAKGEALEAFIERMETP